MVDFQYKGNYDVSDFIKIIALLRSEGGCPWDMEQTHKSIRRNLLEEAYEVCEAIDDEDPEHLKEELGDLLMQIIFHSRIEEESGVFSLNDVADTACKKLIRRHPHVFSSQKADTAEEVLANWDEIKKTERSQKNTSSVMDGVAKSLPALWRAEKILSKAAKDGFVLPDTRSSENSFEGLGDNLFSLVNRARHSDIDPEYALSASCDRFILSYKKMEATLKD